MAVQKIVGIETEYGIIARGATLEASVASALLVNSYLGECGDPAAWDWDHETPGADARGFVVPELAMQGIDPASTSAVLTNGARYYVDHAHPEYCTPECSGPRQVVVHDRAGEEIVRRSMVAARRSLPDGCELVIHKNNSDGKGNSYGCHENYLLDRRVPFGSLARAVTVHLVSRQVITGAGKVGSEGGGSDTGVGFQIAQRADFFEEEIGLETTIRRPIVNTRDEPHADPEKYRRLHVIVGDANMSETSTLVKVGSTALVLCLIEDGLFPDDIELRDPVHEMRAVSRDCSLRHEMVRVDGAPMRALEVQWRLLEAAEKYVLNGDHDPIGGDAELVLGEWRRLIEGLDDDPASVADSVDWVAKRMLVDAYAERHGLGLGDPRLKMIDLQYSDLRPGKCLASRVGLRTVVTADEVRTAIGHPPEDTRAFFRGECLRRWPESVVAANWDGLVIDVGGGALRRIPTMEPSRGTRSLVGQLLESATSPADLVDRLAGVVETAPIVEPGW